MHLQENVLFDLDVGANVTRNVAQYFLHHVTYAPARFDVATCEGFGRRCIYKKMLHLTFSLGPRSHEISSTLYIM